MVHVFKLNQSLGHRRRMQTAQNSPKCKSASSTLESALPEVSS